MGEILTLQRAATVKWTPPDGQSMPVQSLQQLHVLVSTFCDYGPAATVHMKPGDGREVIVTALGADGWHVRLRNHRSLKGRWPCSSTVVRSLADSEEATAITSSKWYLAGDSSDLVGCLLFAEQIQSASEHVAQVAWSWLAGEPLPPGYAAGKDWYHPVVCDSLADALAWIAYSGEDPWPVDAAEATIDLAGELDIDRVIVTSPGQITARLRESGRRIRFLRRGKGTDAPVHVVGMVDELGREYTMKLPGREIVQIKRTRTAR